MLIQQLGFSRNRLLILVGVATLIVFPALYPPSWILFAMIIVISDAIVILGFNLLVGYAGIPFLVPLFFMAVGAYSAGWLSVNTGIHPVINVILGAFMAMISSFIFSLVSAKVKGWFMALYSLMMFFLIGTIFIQQELWIVYWTGGPFGMIEIPDIALPALGLNMRDFEGAPYYYLLLGILIVTGFATFKLVYRTRLGLAIRSMKQNDFLAEQLGVNLLKIRVYVFMISSFVMGISAALIAHFLGSAVPGQYFTISELIHYHFELIAGGLGSLTGPVVGSLIMVLYDEFFIYYPPYYLLFKGLLITVLLLLMPLGVMGEIEQRLFRRRTQDTRSSIPLVIIARRMAKAVKEH